ncbi:MAG: phage Gp37/Gp68 family protein, partial [Hyphomicrobiaceae bacterium]
AVTRKSGGGRPVWTGRLHINDAALEIPLRWRSPRRIFVNSMSDLFQEGVPREIIRKVWDVMKRAKQHTYQILTKRPENMMAVIEDERIAILPNVWLGTSVESADYTDRIAVLRQIPAAVRFVSFEPLLGPVGRIELRDVHWAIVGGESGPSARPMDARWVTEIKSMCDRSGTAFFFKQWGGTNKRKTGRLLQGRTWDEYPAIGVSGAR